MEVDDSLSFTLGMATGGDDPVSTNQTLDGGFSTKDIRLDLAHFDYKFNDSLSLTGGKMKNPFYKPGKTPAFWDSDLNPEGFALKINSGATKGTLVGFSVEERKSDSDSYLIGAQLTHDFSVSDSSTLVVGAGYYNYTSLKGFGTLFDSKARGNSVDADGNYLTDFNIAEFLIEYKTKLAGQPLSFFGNLHKNTAADDLDTSIVYGVNYGKVQGAGSWNMGLSYIDNDADSVVGLFNDSDFAGGNTDSKGFLLKYGYGIKKNLSFGFTYINSEFGQSQVEKIDYKRLQLDLKMKFK
ncbi:MAG: putative porin, partial [Kangiellaceae bacterium]|nr:putative porin [Kangiellaceae bacterium]